MAKRFRDTEIWGREWFVGLTCAERCAIDYILCRCDAVGVWPPAFSVAERLIGERVDWEALPGKTNGNVQVLPNGKWHVVDFCDFQYGGLKESCAPHRYYLALLEKHGLGQGYCKGTLTLKEKELEKEKEKEKERGPGPGTIEYRFAENLWYGITDEQVSLWQEAYPAVDVELELRQMGEWCKSAGAKGHKQNWRRFVVNWLKRAQDRPPAQRVGRR